MTPAMAVQVMQNRTLFSNNKSMLERIEEPSTLLVSRARLDFRVIFELQKNWIFVEIKTTFDALIVISLEPVLDGAETYKLVFFSFIFHKTLPIKI